MTEKVIKVAEILDRFRLVLNVGTDNGVEVGQTYLVYRLGKEIFDPDTKKSLGELEIVVGRGRIDSVQPKMATLKSMEVTEKPHRTKRVRIEPSAAKLISWSDLFSNSRVEEIVETEPDQIAPFRDPSVGNLAKRI